MAAIAERSTGRRLGRRVEKVSPTLWSGGYHVLAVGPGRRQAGVPVPPRTPASASTITAHDYDPLCLHVSLSSELVSGPPEDAAPRLAPVCDLCCASFTLQRGG